MNSNVTMNTHQWICFLNKKTISLEEKIRIIEQEAHSGFYYGNYPPSNTIGSVGDYYLQFTGGGFYLKRESGWTLEGEIQMLSVDGGKI